MFRVDLTATECTATTVPLLEGAERLDGLGCFYSSPSKLVATSNSGCATVAAGLNNKLKLGRGSALFCVPGARTIVVASDACDNAVAALNRRIGANCGGAGDDGSPPADGAALVVSPAATSCTGSVGLFLAGYTKLCGVCQDEKGNAFPGVGKSMPATQKPVRKRGAKTKTKSV